MHEDDMLPQRKPLHHCPGYTCKTINKCIPKKRRCDKIVDCLYGDDEIECQKRNSISSLFKHAVRHMMGYDDLSRSNVEAPGNSSAEVVSTTVDSIASTTFKMENSPITDTVNRNGFVKDDTSFASPAALSDRNESISNTEASHTTWVDITTKQDSVDESTTGATFIPPETTKSFVNTTTLIKPLKEERFLCRKMLEIIPLGKKCDKIIDCQDGTDEDCTCADYLKNSHPEAICDGITDCRDLSDEKDCGSCTEQEFYCRLSKTCVANDKRCDNKADCMYNEDEWDCFALTDKYRMVLDADLRPVLNVKGILTFNNHGNWRPGCGNFTGIEEKIAADVCVTLGFGDYEKYFQLVVSDRALIVAGGDDVVEEDISGNSTCTALYVKCSNVTIKANEIGSEDRLNAPNELYSAPWNAAVYADGEYKCTGTILNLNWILTSINCFPGILKLHQHYVAVLLGTGRGHFNVGGPHEQIIPIAETIQVAQSDAVLLRLSEKVAFTRYVRPLHFQRKSDFIRYKETCVAMGTDLNQTSKAVLLKPVQNCTTGFRCFKRLDALPSECRVKHPNPWSGCIVCDSGNGFYPAAVFHESQGECGFSRAISLSNIANIKREIFAFMKLAAFVVEPPRCPVFRCKLGKCIEAEKLCNKIPDCRDSTDEAEQICNKKEHECHLTETCVCGLEKMRCANGKCVSKTKFCDQVDDCGDGSDEPDRCNCQAYLRLADPSKICDGHRNCLDRSDENPDICRCNSGQFKCGQSSVCIPNDMVCDGYKDCPESEDEVLCLSLRSPDNNSKVGEVLKRTNGVWHSGCFPEHLTTSALEAICEALGFTGSSAAYLNNNKTVTRRPFIDHFNFIWIHKSAGSRVKLAMRSGNNPFVHFVNDPNCYKLFIQCL